MSPGTLGGDEIAVLASLEDAEEAFALLAPLGTADAEDFARGLRRLRRVVLATPTALM